MDSITLRCGTCKTQKSVKDFHRNNSRKTGYSNACKVCVLKRTKARYDKNPEFYRAKTSKWREKNPGAANEMARRYREKYPERAKDSVRRYKQANQESIKLATKAWAIKNHESILSRNRQKRAIKRNAISEPYTKDDILNRWGTDCHICNKPIDLTASRRRSNGLHLDHVIPLSKGGPDIIANIKPAHAFCNISKKDKLIP